MVNPVPCDLSLRRDEICDADHTQCLWVVLVRKRFALVRRRHSDPDDLRAIVPGFAADFFEGWALSHASLSEELKHERGKVWELRDGELRQQVVELAVEAHRARREPARDAEVELLAFELHEHG